VPVIASNRSALAEIAAGAALLVNPESVEELAESLRRMAADGQLREDLKQKGLARAATYTWPEAVRKTWSVYEELT
jgi:glycosyltransferase involved in cell wall biosynthesis